MMIGSTNCRLSNSIAVQPAPMDYGAFIRTFGRHMKWLVAWILLCVAVAVFYLAITPPEYIATTQVVVEPMRRDRLVVDPDGDPSPMDSAQADSRLQVIQSERLLRFVFDSYQNVPKGLDHPELRERPRSWFGSNENPTLGDDRRAFRDFAEHVSARRMGNSYVIEISFRASSPILAARMANSIAAAYLRDLVLSTPNESELLQKRILNLDEAAQILLKAVETGTVPAKRINGIDSRIISAAIEPLTKSSPRSTLILLLAFAVAMTTGFGIELVLNARDNTVRSARWLSRTFDLDCIMTLHGGRRKRRRAQDNKVLQQVMGALLLRRDHLKVGLISCGPTIAASTIARRAAEELSAKSHVSLVVDALSTSVANLIPIENLTQSREPMQHRALSSETGMQVCSSRDGVSRSWMHDDAQSLGVLDALVQRGHVVAVVPNDVLAKPLKAAAWFDLVVLVIERDRTSMEHVAKTISRLEAGGVSSIGAMLVCNFQEDRPSKGKEGRGATSPVIATAVFRGA